MFTMHQECEDYQRGKSIKVEKVIHHAAVSNLFGFGYMKKSSNAQGSSKYYLFVTAPFLYLKLRFVMQTVHN